MITVVINIVIIMIVIVVVIVIYDYRLLCVKNVWIKFTGAYRH